ncbi:MAG: helix-turn-helix transcriptional regulator, partial [Pseudomonadota bacterium]
MLSHGQVWAAIDGLAARKGMSPSGLAKLAGLDPTTFNKSKRIGPDGRLRWPNTESIARLLDATATPIDSFMALMADDPMLRPLPEQRSMPLIGMAEAGQGGFFDDGGFPAGSGWDEVAFPDVPDRHAYALEISGDSMMPLYRDGDVIIVSPESSIRRGDRIVVKTHDGEVMAKILARKTAKTI